MNWVLLCDKSKRKELEPQIVGGENLLGTVTEFNDKTILKIFEQYNPHGIIIADFGSEIALKFKQYRENLKVIYLTEITLDSEDLVKELFQNNITVSDKLDLENLPSYDTVLETFKELRRKKLAEISAETDKNDNKYLDKKAKKYKLSFDKNTLESNSFNAAKTLIINEKEVAISKGKVFIGLTELQHHIGCTHVSFEIAELLRQKSRCACVVIWDKVTFESLAKFYGLPGCTSFEVNKVTVFSYDMLETAIKDYEYIVCDYGFMREDFRIDFAETSIKIMLVSGANWDLNVITNYLNVSEDSYKNEINYLFYPIKQADFIKLNRQFLRNNLKAYRLQTSPECTLPCKENKAIYGRILGLDGGRRGK